MVDANITGSAFTVGGLVGQNSGTVSHCYSTGSISGNSDVGGLVGGNYGTVTDCNSTGAVTGKNIVGGLMGRNLGTLTDCRSMGAVTGADYATGGLVGLNEGPFAYGYVTGCYSTGPVKSSGEWVGGMVGDNWGSIAMSCSQGPVNARNDVGGLAGRNVGRIMDSYSRGSVSGDRGVGGLVGGNSGGIATSYSSGAVDGTSDVGGLLGRNEFSGTITSSLWDIQTSGQSGSAGGAGLMTAEMQTAKTFLDAGWDFVDETANGTEDIWWIDEGKDYPRLWWELNEGGMPPVAEAGLSRYAGTEPVQLDGTGSFDPDGAGQLCYAWRQLSGPAVELTGADTATPQISRIVQTGEIQECEFELIVSDGELASVPDTVKVVIVPDFGPSISKLENPSFDPNKPTIIYFYGGDCINGSPGHPWEPGPVWLDRANVIDFPYGYTPDSGAVPRSYYKYGDMVLTYLSAVAPDYKQAIQTIGFSTGVDPALDVGLRLNEIYRDARYAVNRVTQIDGGCRMIDAANIGGMAEAWAMQLESYRRFLESAVDGEQCWIDFCYGVEGYRSEPIPPSSVLWVRTGLDHRGVNNWYRNSLTNSDMNQFNGGVVGGAYWSVVGPGKNLQLASLPGAYYFEWEGDAQKGATGFFSPSVYPGRLPEPVTLLDRRDPNLPVEDPNGLVLTCKESANAVGYQLLSGSDPYHIASYTVVADGNTPPAVTAAMLPPGDTWWTVKVRDAHGSTIHADPIRVGQPLGLTAHGKPDE
ncbi:MAG: GLUG motif-containing protein [Solirubrobacterales bacterium]